MPMGPAVSPILIAGSGLASTSGALGFGANISSQVPASNSQSIAYTLTAQNSGKNQFGVGGRMASDGTSGYVILVYGVVFYLQVRVGGSLTTLGTWDAVTSGAASGRVVLDLTDGFKRVYVNGVLRISSTDNSVTQVGQYAIATNYADSIGNAGAYISNFEAYAR